jgi:hypothetical protein
MYCFVLLKIKNVHVQEHIQMLRKHCAQLTLKSQWTEVPMATIRNGITTIKRILTKLKFDCNSISMVDRNGG